MAEKRKNFNILVVDDDESIRMMLTDYLEDKYNVVSVDSGEVALGLLAKNEFNLVISDINMPGISGPQLLSQIKKRFPSVRTALITAYDIDDYIWIAKEKLISNIIPKTIPFNFGELDSIVSGLLTGDIFGIRRYLLEKWQLLGKFCVRSSQESKIVREEVIRLLDGKYGSSGDMKLIIDEIITNAIYHAPVHDDGTEKYEEFTDVALLPDEYVYVECGCDQEKYAVSISDNKGNLSREKVLFKIQRQITGEGLLDDSGRGIHMSRLFSDRMVINIDPNKRTEVILINYFSDKYRGYKPLYINEL
jgi:CheY-like chemotaxis protein/anti-sigma regulatory factor (Ser/Thr protein kinase)